MDFFESRCLRLFCVAEPGALHDNPRIPFFCLGADLGANVLAFSVTVSPDKQGLAVLGLFSDILCNGGFVLSRPS
jgi:hypothetical protein